MRVKWVSMDQGGPGCVQVGDLVSADAGGLPLYRVMSLDNGRAWLRDLETGADCISPVSRFHWKACAEG
jgi:hypothetical protein